MASQLEGHRKENKVKLVDFQMKGRAKGLYTSERKLVKLLALVAPGSQYLKSNCLTFSKVGQGHGLFEVGGQIV